MQSTATLTAAVAAQNAPQFSSRFYHPPAILS